MGILDKIFRRRRRHRRVDVRQPVRIAECEETFYTQDLAQGGMRLNIGRHLSLADVTGGTREVRITIELSEGDPPAGVIAEPIWTVRTDGGELSTGWMFSRYEGDALKRLQAFVDAAE